MTLFTSSECLQHFGKPESEAHMTVWDVPASLEIGAIPRKVYCSKLMPLALEEAFRNLISTGSIHELRTYDGCFNVRRKKGNSGSYSMHAWGLAIDLNAAWNGFGAKPTLSNGFVECFTSEGFIWGGNWRTPDGMHFELSKEYILRNI